MRTILVALVCGALFGAGLVLSGMADPARVLGFLTLGPGWDPQLAFVMGGALAVALPGFAWLRHRGQPLSGGALESPPTRSVDRPLILGATIFGLGWGLAGYCPGPGIVAAGLGFGGALLFVAAMLAGATLVRR
jgi:uncharacterized protein